MKHFIIIYVLSAGRIELKEEIASGARAHRRFSDLEMLHMHDRDREVVMLSARSFDALRKTHPHYFGASPEVSPTERSLAAMQSTLLPS